MPCHAAVCVNCDLGSNVQFLRVITQSTGHTFLPGLPIGKKLGSNSTFMYRKTLCKVVEQCTEYIFVLSFIRLALFRQLNIKLKSATFSIPKSRCIELQVAVNYLFPPKPVKNHRLLFSQHRLCKILRILFNRLSKSHRLA